MFCKILMHLLPIVLVRFCPYSTVIIMALIFLLVKTEAYLLTGVKIGLTLFGIKS